MTRVVDTATATSPTNDAMMQPLTYSHDKVRLLLENARNEGKAEGFDEGYEVGLQDGVLKDEDIFKKFREEEEKEAREAAFVNGRKEGEESGRLKERRSWETHHGTKCCISVQNHIRELWRGAVLLEEAQVQTDPETTTWSDVSTQAAPKTDEIATQTNDALECRCATLQT
jgi:hypothetical protein